MSRNKTNVAEDGRTAISRISGVPEDKVVPHPKYIIAHLYTTDRAPGGIILPESLQKERAVLVAVTVGSEAACYVQPGDVLFPVVTRNLSFNLEEVGPNTVAMHMDSLAGVARGFDWQAALKKADSGLTEVLTGSQREAAAQLILPGIK